MCVCERVQEETRQTNLMSTMESWQPVHVKEALQVRDIPNESDPEMGNQAVKRLVVSLRRSLVKKSVDVVTRERI